MLQEAFLCCFLWKSNNHLPHLFGRWLVVIAVFHFLRRCLETQTHSAWCRGGVSRASTITGSCLLSSETWLVPSLSDLLWTRPTIFYGSYRIKLALARSCRGASYYHRLLVFRTGAGWPRRRSLLLLPSNSICTPFFSQCVIFKWFLAVWLCNTASTTL